MTKGSDLLVAALENEGVDRIFGIRRREPGCGGIAALVPDRAGADLVEQAAACRSPLRQADRATRRLHLDTGAGALNFSTAAYAHLGAMPMILITGQKPISDRASGAVPDRRRDRLHEAADQDVGQIVGAASIPTIVRDSFRVAMEERRGRFIWNCRKTSRRRTPMPQILPIHPIDGQWRTRSTRSRRRHDPSRQAPLIMIGAAGNRPGWSSSPDFVRRRASPSSTPRWARAPSRAASTCTWASYLSGATTCIGRSTGPT